MDHTLTMDSTYYFIPLHFVSFRKFRFARFQFVSDSFSFPINEQKNLWKYNFEGEMSCVDRGRTEGLLGLSDFNNKVGTNGVVQWLMTTPAYPRASPCNAIITQFHHSHPALLSGSKTNLRSWSTGSLITTQTIMVGSTLMVPRIVWMISQSSFFFCVGRDRAIQITSPVDVVNRAVSSKVRQVQLNVDMPVREKKWNHHTILLLL